MRAIWVLAFIAIVGCNFGTSAAMTVDNSCAGDASCAEGVCDVAICIDDSGASVEVAIEVLRGASDLLSATPMSWAFAPESASGASIRDLDLPPTREVRGTVRWDGSRVPAMLRFVRRMAEPVATLTPVEVEVDTLRDTAGGDGPDGYDFSVFLVAGETYDVTVLPSSDVVTSAAQPAAPAVRSLPPLYLLLSVDGGEPSAPLRFDIAFGANLSEGCVGAADAGCTLEAEVFSVDGGVERAEAGLQVRAVDKQTQRVVSSIGETDENGRFAIRLGASATDYWIRVTSSAGHVPFPSVSVDPALAFANNPAGKRIYIPRINPVRFTGRVRDANGVPIPGATVRFFSTGIFGGSQLGLEGSFSDSASTDAEGRFATDLLPGFYTISVTPPSDVANAWGILSAEALVGDAITATEALIVPPQIGLRGWVTTFSDEAAAGITILARARSGTGWDARSQESVSNTIGAFAMTLDAGLYDLQVKVSSDSGFAWLVEPDLLMSADSGERLRAYQLAPPIPIRGVLRSGDGKAVPNALVRAYILVDTGGGTTRPLQVAETVSGEDGSYRLLIAPGFGGE